MLRLIKPPPPNLPLVTGRDLCADGFAYRQLILAAALLPFVRGDISATVVPLLRITQLMLR